jgi:hypothetical protein
MATATADRLGRQIANIIAQAVRGRALDGPIPSRPSIQREPEIIIAAV